MASKSMWELEIRHEGLGKYRHIRGSDRHVVEQKAAYQAAQWDQQWESKLEKDRKAQESSRKAAERDQEIRQNARLKEQTAQEKARQKEQEQQRKEDRRQEGIERDTSAKVELEKLRNILNHTLKINDAINWDQLKDTTPFKEPAPKLKLPPPPKDQPLPPTPVSEVATMQPSVSSKSNPPSKNSAKYQPVFGLMDNFISSWKSKKIEAATQLFNNDYAEWAAECKKLDDHDACELKNWEARKAIIESSNVSRNAEWERTVARIKTENIGKKSYWEKSCDEVRAKHSFLTKQWEDRKTAFLESQKETNAAVDLCRGNYIAKDQGAIADYCDSVLSNSTYPDYFPKQWDMDYNAETRTLVVEYALPAPESLPTLKEVLYQISKDDYKETYLSEKERDTLYDSLLYQMALRTVHELFEADTAEALDVVAFAGIVTALDKTTGHHVTACILSVLARKEAFMQINLASVEPKACFKSLKGVAAASLAGLAPVAPILTIDKSDRRFVDGYAVAETIDSKTNLAIMDWEDFEHLIREVFEQEFATGGGEVKVTQASRDGGVDAVAFDPDPIKGGKTVIQAKRYANTVGVSAVRDLYGTVTHEGANKGILVTTSDYGPDAYEFASNKPLTLINGSQLLWLLEKHGHQARINLNEAKLENKQNMR